MAPRRLESHRCESRPCSAGHSRVRSYSLVREPGCGCGIVRWAVIAEASSVSFNFARQGQSPDRHVSLVPPFAVVGPGSVFNRTSVLSASALPSNPLKRVLSRIPSSSIRQRSAPKMLWRWNRSFDTCLGCRSAIILTGWSPPGTRRLPAPRHRSNTRCRRLRSSNGFATEMRTKG